MAIYLDQTLAQGAASVLAPGLMSHTADSVAPAGWLIRDGSSIAVASYPQLFAILGYTYGGAGANFNLPDDRGLVDAGSGLGTAVAGLTSHALGSVGGEETHAQTSAELATHSHTQNSHNHTQDAHTHTQNSHNHTQDAHTHTQNSHNHTQDAHTHTQNSHTHPRNASGVGEYPPVDTGSFNYNTVGSGQLLASQTNTGSQTATNQNTTATNQAATATNQNTTATNQAATATNQNTTATNQAATATNQNTGSGTPFNVIQPTRYYTPIIKY